MRMASTRSSSGVGVILDLCIGACALFVPELPAILGLFGKLFFNSQELVVFGDAIAAGGGAGFDLAAVGGDGEIGDGGVLGFAGAMREDRAVAVANGEVDGGESFA